MTEPNRKKQKVSHETEDKKAEEVEKYSGKSANFPVDADGRTYHTFTRIGEIANRVVCVGCYIRATTLAELYFDNKKYFTVRADRGFVIHTGLFKGVPITIIGTGMGFPLTDFTIRELRYCCTGEMAFIRVGTCGSFNPTVPIGNLAVPTKGIRAITRNVNAFLPKNKDMEPYLISDTIYMDKTLTDALHKNLVKYAGKDNVLEAHCGSADSFYSSQGRTMDYFEDRLDGFHDILAKKKIVIDSLEMESFQMAHLAMCSKPKFKVIASCCACILATRLNDKFVSKALQKKRIAQGGQAAFITLAEYKIQNEMDEDRCIWKHLDKEQK